MNEHIYIEMEMDIESKERKKPSKDISFLTY